ncbi:glycosyltransferase family 2 protein [Desulfarculus baarsii]|nr:glycosyltransferase family 2 protein [Desulfarculus baarsii]
MDLMADEAAKEVTDRKSRAKVLLLKGVIVTALIGMLTGGVVLWDDIMLHMKGFVSTDLGGVFFILANVSGAVGLFSLIWRVVLTLMYKSEAPCSDDELPTITIVVPAYNEGSQVLKTLRSIAASDYPAAKMQLIAVDDGSKDDTWLWMKRASRELGERLDLRRLDRNSGKRRALYEGFMNSTGEILVTIDSDSEIAPDTLRHLITPFVREAQVGSVAGNVRVLNAHRGMIPKMMDVSFTFSFDFIRASQSQVNTVLTTPGALSAYRDSVVRPDLEGWLNQTFCGRPANIGEDRALTNLVLKAGYFVRFARKAVVYTEVPLGYKGLCRMLLRWARSNVRESLVMGRFVFTNFRKGGKLGGRINFLLQVFAMTVGEVLKISAVCTLVAYPLIMGGNFLVGAAMGGTVPALFYLLRHRNSNCLWGFPYCLFWVLTLSWISLYALVTPHRSSWLTRGLTEEHKAVAEQPDPWTVSVAASARTGLR